MYSILIGLFLIPSFLQVPQSDNQDPELAVIIDELDQALDSFFSLLDEQDLDVFISGVNHAARARLLLEQYLGEEIDDLSLEAQHVNPKEFQLRLIAKRASELTGDAGKELWILDYDRKQWALLRLSELENLVKGLKTSIADK